MERWVEVLKLTGYVGIGDESWFYTFCGYEPL